MGKFSETCGITVKSAVMSQNFYVSVAKNSQEAIECFRNSEENSTLYGSGLCRLNGLEVEKFRENKKVPQPHNT